MGARRVAIGSRLCRDSKQAPGRSRVAELIAAAKASSDRLSYGTAGHGSGQHLSGALLASMADIRLQHRPFGGGAVGSTELLAKHIDFLFDTPTLLLELIRSGFVRAIAVTGRERFFALPDVPTIAETVAGYETSSWLGLAGPRELPADIVTSPEPRDHRCLAEPVMNERLRSLGNLPAPSTPADFIRRVAADVAKWSKVVADAGITRTQ